MSVLGTGQHRKLQSGQNSACLHFPQLGWGWKSALRAAPGGWQPPAGSQAVCLPCRGRRTTMIQGQQKLLYDFSPALPGGWEAEAGAGLLSSACALLRLQQQLSSSQAQQGKDSVDAFQCPGKVPGPSGIQLLVLSRANMSQSCNPWQSGRQTVFWDFQPGALLCWHLPAANTILLPKAFSCSS